MYFYFKYQEKSKLQIVATFKPSTPALPGYIYKAQINVTYAGFR